MAESKDKKIIECYEKYIDLLDLMLNDMSGITIENIHEVIDELHKALKKI